MELKLSCYCCGGTEFKRTPLDGLINIENTSYLYQGKYYNNMVTCKSCGLEDYIQNLVIKFT